MPIRPPVCWCVWQAGQAISSFHLLLESDTAIQKQPTTWIMINIVVACAFSNAKYVLSFAAYTQLHHCVYERVWLIIIMIIKKDKRTRGRINHVAMISFWFGSSSNLLVWINLELCMSSFFLVNMCVLTILLQLTARTLHTRLSIGLTGRRTAEAGSTLTDR